VPARPVSVNLAFSQRATAKQVREWLGGGTGGRRAAREGQRTMGQVPPAKRGGGGISKGGRAGDRIRLGRIRTGAALQVGHGRVSTPSGDGALETLIATQWASRLHFREFYYNDAGVQIRQKLPRFVFSTPSPRRRLKAGDPGWREKRYNGELASADHIGGRDCFLPVGGARTASAGERGIGRASSDGIKGDGKISMRSA